MLNLKIFLFCLGQDAIQLFLKHDIYGTAEAPATFIRIALKVWC